MLVSGVRSSCDTDDTKASLASSSSWSCSIAVRCCSNACTWASEVPRSMPCRSAMSSSRVHHCRGPPRETSSIQPETERPSRTGTAARERTPSRRSSSSEACAVAGCLRTSSTAVLTPCRPRSSISARSASGRSLHAKGACSSAAGDVHWPVPEAPGRPSSWCTWQASAPAASPRPEAEASSTPTTSVWCRRRRARSATTRSRSACSMISSCTDRSSRTVSTSARVARSPASAAASRRCRSRRSSSSNRTISSSGVGLSVAPGTVPRPGTTSGSPGADLRLTRTPERAVDATGTGDVGRPWAQSSRKCSPHTARQGGVQPSRRRQIHPRRSGDRRARPPRGRLGRRCGQVIVMPPSTARVCPVT